MARISVEDCLRNVESPFSLVHAAVRRARQLQMGSKPLMQKTGDKNTVIALREIARGLVEQVPLSELEEETRTQEPITPDEEFSQILDLPDLNGKKVLFIWGGWPGHDPELCRDIFVPWMREQGAEVTVSDNLDTYLDEEYMASLDLVVQIWTMGQITGDQEKGLLNIIKSGCGLAGWHGGLGDSHALGDFRWFGGAAADAFQNGAGLQATDVFVPQ